MHIEWNILQGLFAALLGGGIAGAITGAIVAHFLAKRRDSDNRKHLNILDKSARKRQFVAVVTKWRSQADRENTSATANRFNDDVSVFASEAAKIMPDYGHDFETLITSVTEMKAGQIEQANCHQKLLEQLGKIIRFLERQT
jgi:gas vesicle protein